MPKYKAIFIPPWVKEAVGNIKDHNNNIYSHLPFLGHWRNVDYLENLLVSYSANAALGNQIKQILDHLKQLVVTANGTHPVVTRVSTLAHLTHQLFISITTDEVKPVASGYLIVKVNDAGDITEVVREYSMGYDANSKK